MQQAVDRRAVATDNARPDPRRPAAFLCGMVTFVALDHTVPAAPPQLCEHAQGPNRAISSRLHGAQAQVLRESDLQGRMGNCGRRMTCRRRRAMCHGAAAAGVYPVGDGDGIALQAAAAAARGTRTFLEQVSAGAGAGLLRIHGWQGPQSSCKCAHCSADGQCNLQHQPCKGSACMSCPCFLIGRAGLYSPPLNSFPQTMHFVETAKRF